jgi:acetoin utilization protein AcuB
MKRSKLLVREWMMPDPATVAPQDPLHTVVGLLRRRGIRAVPVIEEGKLIGIITDRDVRQAAPCYPLLREEDELSRYTQNLKVAAVMTPDPLRISPNASLMEAAKLLDLYGISSLPVVNEDALVGMISVTDLLRAFIEQNTNDEEAVQ